MSHANDRLLRLADVRAATGLSRSTIYKLMRAGDFPQSVQLTPKLVAWWESEVTAWWQNRPRSNRR